MTKKEFIDRASESQGVTKTRFSESLESVVEALTELFENEDEVIIKGFGRFGVKNRRGREYRNPLTGDKINKPDSKLPYFKPSETLRDMY